jgi:phosphohistidine phosphatase SixA
MRVASYLLVLLLATPVAALGQPVAPAAGTTARVGNAPAAANLEGRALVGALRRGGYVLYLRHTSTDFSQNDAAMTSYADCASQRNLTDAGREEARMIAAGLRDLRIPIGDVLASPYCRTMESGRLAFGKATASTAVRGGPAQSESSERYADLRRLLSTPLTARTNLAIASHGNPFHAVAGPPYLAEGEIAVVQPLGNSEFRIVARVPKTGWAQLATTP